MIFEKKKNHFPSEKKRKENGPTVQTHKETKTCLDVLLLLFGLLFFCHFGHNFYWLFFRKTHLFSVAFFFAVQLPAASHGRFFFFLFLRRWKHLPIGRFFFTEFYRVLTGFVVFTGLYRDLSGFTEFFSWWMMMEEDDSRRRRRETGRVNWNRRLKKKKVSTTDRLECDDRTYCSAANFGNNFGFLGYFYFLLVSSSIRVWIEFESAFEWTSKMTRSEGVSSCSLISSFFFLPLFFLFDGTTAHRNDIVDLFYIDVLYLLNGTVSFFFHFAVSGPPSLYLDHRIPLVNPVKPSLAS